MLDPDQGLCALRGNQVIPVPQGASLVPERRICMAPLDSRRLLLAHRDGRFQAFDLSAFWDPQAATFDFSRPAPPELASPFPTELSRSPRKDAASLYKIQALESGTFALCTLKNGLVLMNREGKVTERLNTRALLLSDTIIDCFQDRSGHLWVLMNQGLAYVERNLPQRVLGAAHGWQGLGHAAIAHQGRVYLGSDQGIKWLPPARPLEEEVQLLKPIQGSPQEGWDFLSLGSELLVATDTGLGRIQQERIQLLGPKIPAYCLLQLRQAPDQVLMGTMDGLHRFRQEAGTWKWLGRLPGITETLRNLTQDARGDVWAATEANGLLRIRCAEGNLESPPVERFSTMHGLPGSANLRVFAQAETLFVTGTKGLHRARIPAAPPLSAGQIRFEPDLDLGAGLLDPPVTTRWMLFSGDQAWLSCDEGIRVGTRQTGVAWKYEERAYQGLSVPDERIALLPGLGLCMPGKVVNFVDPSRPLPAAQPFSALVRRVATQNRLLHDGAHVPEGAPEPRTTFHGTQGRAPEIPYRENTLKFDFAATFFEKPGTTRYQFRLEGAEPEWSPWTAEGQKEYTFLPEGSYVFRVRARNLYGEVSPEDRYAFRILPPWYRTWWGYALWTLLGAGALGLGVALYTARLRRSKQVLEGIVAKRTEQLRVAMVAAERASAFKSIFIANTSHELRTPLNAILGFMRLLTGGGVREEDRRRFDRIILSSAENLLQTVNDLLDLSKIEAGRLDIEPRAFVLRDLLEDTLGMLGSRAMEKPLDLVATVDPHVPAQLLGDSHRIRQMLVNLLGNALKFTQEGHVAVRISWNPGEGGQGILQVRVEDTGPGVPPEVLPRLFNAFTQADSVAKNQGTGLGLSITRQLAELMGGEVGAESRMGQGSCFWFTLRSEALEPPPEDRPLAGQKVQVELPPSALREQVLQILARYGAEATEGDGDWWIRLQPASVSEGPGLLLVRQALSARLPEGVRWLQCPFGEAGFLQALQQAREMEPPAPYLPRQTRKPKGRVLLADDNPANRMLMEALFQQVEVEFTMAEDGQEAVDRFRESPYPLVILDGHMPRLDGNETLAALRQLPGGPEAIILLFTASLTSQNLEAARTLGFDDVLHKPADPEDFRRVVLRRLLEEPLTDPPPEPPSPTFSALGELDAQRLEGLWMALGGREGLQSLVDDFTQDAPNRLARLKEALARGDRDRLSREAHDLKSNSASVGLPRLAGIATNLEFHALEATPDQLAAWILEYETGFPVDRESLEAWLNRKG